MSIDAEPTPLDRSSAPPLRVVAWELTAACPLQCRHCRVGDGGRAGADHAGRSDELSPAEARDALDQIAALAPKLLILTGGEPMLREDFYDLTARAVGHGLRVAAAPCGALVTPDTARRMLQAGIRRISLSLDGPDAATHDAFRGTTGAHATVLSAVAAARVAGLPFQINTTVHRGNVEALPAMREQVRQEGAAGWDLFFLVPTGRGRALAGQELAPDAMLATLRWVAEAAQDTTLPIKVTCAPAYVRVADEAGLAGTPCLGGQGFAFLGRTGTVQACGFLDRPAGSIRRQSFADIWRTSPLFRALRDRSSYGGACGACAWVGRCGGCRARAFEATGDPLQGDPGCPFAEAEDAP